MPAGRMRSWLAVSHSLRVEVTLALSLYAAYEVARGLAVSDRAAAVDHARWVVSVERSLNFFVERGVQQAVTAVPGLVGVLGVAYLSLHLAVTAGLLLWLHRRHPAAYPFVRTALLLASALALVGFLLFPTAPPRLAGIGIVDTVSGDHVDLNRGLVHALYNPYAAVPSMHVGYALVVGACLVRLGRRHALRATGLLYPVFVSFVVVATGNHFVFDAVVGAAVTGVAAVAAVLIHRRPVEGRLARLHERAAPPTEHQQLAA
jgi:PAP2 superfamily